MDGAAARAQVVETVRALNRAWTIDRDTTRLDQYFHRDMVAITPTERLRLDGREACIAAWERFMGRAKVTRFEERDLDVRLHGQERLAIVTYYYDMTVEVDGKTTALSGRDLLVLVREAHDR